MDCSICDNEFTETYPTNGFHTIECKCCGKYCITTEAKDDVEGILKDRRYLLSGVTRESILKKLMIKFLLR